MKKQLYRLIKLFLLMAFSFTLITACYQPVSQKHHLSTKTATGIPVETKMVSHALGQIEIPLHPQRVVVLEHYFLLDSLLALGIKPVGIPTCLTCMHEDKLTKLVTNIPTVGDRGNPSLEKILNLKPDLILALEWQKQSYPLLSAIAPTVMIPWNKLDFKKDLRYIAQVVGKSDRIEAIITESEKRIQQFRQKFGKELKAKTVSLVYLYGSDIYVYKPDTMYLSQILSEIGLQFTPTYKKMKDDVLLLSLETLPEYDADFLFVSIEFNRDSGSPNSLSFLKQPIWSTLKAVRNKQVYVGQWGGVGGPITANYFFDNLEQYFVNTP